MEVEERGSSSDFGSLLRRHRLAAGLSQEALAERARMSSDGISALERGHRRTPQRETLTLLAGALALDDEQLAAFEAAASRPSLPRGGSVTVGPWTGVTTARLPVSLTSFVGREAELAEIIALVREHRLVTIAGAGGVGKTQTALRVSTRLSGDDSLALCFVEFAPLSDRTRVAETIAAALGVQETPNRSLPQTIVNFLTSKSFMLVLDNCEHVIERVATIVDEIMASCPAVRILSTSREPLRVADERVYRLPPLNESSAIELFCDRARAADHQFALTNSSATKVRELCSHLEGIPLAIELSAARVNAFSVEMLVEKLGSRLHLLSGGVRTALPRQRTMRATIEWSYDLLSAKERQVFECLAVFSGGCTLETATAVCADAEEAMMEELPLLLSSLVDKSLVVVDLELDECRYVLLEPFRQFGHESLVARGELERVSRRHAVTFLKTAERLDTAHCSERQDVWQRLRRVELDNWRAALQWSLRDGHDVTLGQRLVGKLSTLWQALPAEGRRWVSRAIAAATPDASTDIAAALEFAAALIAHQFRENESQLAHSDHSATLYRKIGDILGYVRAQIIAGLALMRLGRVDDAIARFNESLDKARGLNDSGTTAYASRCLGQAAAIVGDFAAARGHIAEAIAIYEKGESTLEVAWTNGELGEVEFLAGNFQQAIALAAHSLAACREFGDERTTIVLGNLAAYYIAEGRYREGADLARESLTFAIAHQREGLASFAMQHLASAAVLQFRDRANVNGVFVGAAEIFGFVDARLAELGSVRLFVERQEYDRVRAILDAAMTKDGLAASFDRGAKMTEAQAAQRAVDLANVDP